MIKKYGLAILVIAIILTALYFLGGPLALLVALFAIILTGIPFWLWFGRMQERTRQAREKARREKETKELIDKGLVVAPATPDISTSTSTSTSKATVSVDTESTGTHWRDRISSGFWFIWSPLFWVILLAAVALLFWLDVIDIANISDIPWPEIAEGVRLATFLVLVGLLILFLSKFLGRVLVILGLTILLLYLLLPNSLSWINSNLKFFEEADATTGEIILVQDFNCPELFALGTEYRRVVIPPGKELCVDPIDKVAVGNQSTVAVKYVRSATSAVEEVHFYYLPYGADCAQDTNI